MNASASAASAVWSYVGKDILAPMVRVGCLPMRLLALEYGADIVYSPEIIDKKLVQCTRVVNETTGTIDFVANRELVFQTCAAERHAIVLQLGTADPELALAAARLVQDDVNAIDVNMGCPKHFSIHAGMGAALLSNMGRAQAILRALVAGLRVPVTCKVRLHASLDDTLAFGRAMAETGIAALAVHGRTRDQRPRDAASWAPIAALCRALPIPVLLNGDVFCQADIARARSETGCAGVMLARAAQWNVSVFRREGPEPLDCVIARLLRHAVALGGAQSRLVKYCIQQMLVQADQTRSARWAGVQAAKTLADLCALYGVEAPGLGLAAAEAEAEAEAGDGDDTTAERPSGATAQAVTAGEAAGAPAPPARAAKAATKRTAAEADGDKDATLEPSSKRARTSASSEPRV